MAKDGKVEDMNSMDAAENLMETVREKKAELAIALGLSTDASWEEIALAAKRTEEEEGEER